MSTTGCKFYYNNIDYVGSDICRNDKTGYLKCPFVNEFEECQFSNEKAEIPDDISTEAKVMGLDVIRYDMGLAVYLNDKQVAGVEPIGYVRTLAHYDFTENELENVRAEINYALRITDNDE